MITCFRNKICASLSRIHVILIYKIECDLIYLNSYSTLLLKNLFRFHQLKIVNHWERYILQDGDWLWMKRSKLKFSFLFKVSILFYWFSCKTKITQQLFINNFIDVMFSAVVAHRKPMDKTTCGINKVNKFSFHVST